jgi:lipoprotein-anchoring transpeptidase ErfK/SrfK
MESAILAKRGWAMFRRKNVVFAALSLCAASPLILPATDAAAQYRPSSAPAGIYRADPPSDYANRLPAPSWMADDEDDQSPYPYPRRRVEQFAPQVVQGMPSRIAPDMQDADAGNNAGLPPPGLPTQQMSPPNNPDAIRPPAAIGTPPQALQPPQAAHDPAPVSVATLPPEDQPETGEPKELAPNLKRQMVDYQTKEPAGTLIIDTPNTYLYLVLGNGKAIRYGVRVGREGFTWNGAERISKMAEWPDWHPPTEMIERQPYLPRFTAGGPGNPLGARAMYLGKTLYRIHGTNQPSTIGKYVSSGCIGLLNDDVEDLYSRVQVGTRVVVLPVPATTAANVSGGPTAPMQTSPQGEPQAEPLGVPQGGPGAAPISPGGSAITSAPLPPASSKR